MPNGIFTDLINVDVDVAAERTQKRGFIIKIIVYHCPHNSGAPNKPFHRAPNKPFRWISFRKAYCRLRFSDETVSEKLEFSSAQIVLIWGM